MNQTIPPDLRPLHYMCWALAIITFGIVRVGMTLRHTDTDEYCHVGIPGKENMF